MGQVTQGILAIVVACIIWGFAPVYYKLLIHVPPIELLAHRTLWSFLFFFAVLFFIGKVKELWVTMITSKKTRTIVIISSLLIAINWFFFISENIVLDFLVSF